MNANPMSKSKSDFDQTIKHISLSDSPVGIDAQFTHAIILDYLQQIAERLDKIEARLR